MATYRCHNCDPAKGVQFANNTGVCPHCNSKGPPSVVGLVVIHWLCPDPDGPLPGVAGKFKVCCLPMRKHLTGLHATGVPEYVSCDKCRDTDAFRHGIKVWEQLKITDGYDPSECEVT